MFNKDRDKEQNDENLKRLRKKLEPLDSTLIYPASLTPQSVANKLCYNKRKSASFKKIFIASSAFAACFIIVAVVIIYGSFVRTNDTVVNASSYNQVKDTISKLLSNQKTTYTTAKFSQDAIAKAPDTAYNAPETAGNATNSVSSDNSQTTIQVAGVDEADIVKNDGSYLYLALNNKINIVDIRDPKNMKIVATLSYNNMSPAEIFVSGDRLVVLLNNIDNSGKGGIYNLPYAVAGYGSDTTINSSNSNKTTIIIYDIKDRYKPIVKREFSQDGYYISSRLTSGNIYLVSSYNVLNNYYQGKTKIEDLVPRTGNDSTMNILPASDIILPPDPQDASYAVVSGISLNDDSKAVSTMACLGAESNMYVSDKNLYIASVNFKNNQSNTDIIRFSLNDGEVKYSGKGSVPGVTLNQYSMDENDGYLRVATTVYKYTVGSTGTINKGGVAISNANNNMSSNIYVLDGSLKITGKLENIASGESIYAVRYMDKKAYVVTYKTVDPLFAIDLSDPKNPKVLGEVKLPGFSTYLQPYSDNLMIGFGYDTVDTGSTAYMTGLKLSLFDVTDPLNPKELFNYKIGDNGSNSAVLYDPHALLFSKDKNIIGIPVTIYKLDDNQKVEPHVYGKFKFNGYEVFGIDPDKGFVLKGSVTHLDGGDEGTMYNTGTEMLRGAYSGDTLFTISDAKIVSSSLTDFKTISELDLPFKPQNNYSSAPSSVNGSSGTVTVAPAEPVK